MDEDYAAKLFLSVNFVCMSICLCLSITHTNTRLLIRMIIQERTAFTHSSAKHPIPFAFPSPLFFPLSPISLFVELRRAKAQLRRSLQSFKQNVTSSGLSGSFWRPAGWQRDISAKLCSAFSGLARRR